VAGDWIKMRVDLSDNNKVWLLSANLNIDTFSVVGRLHRLWSWADKNTKDGTLRATEAMVDRVVDFPGFAKALVDIQWLVVDGESITFPEFDRHNGQSAKKRAQEAERKRVERSCPQKSGQKADAERTEIGQIEDKTRTREEKSQSRGEHSSDDECNPPNPPKGGGRKKRGGISFDASKATIPPVLDTTEFHAKWQEWCAFRRARRKLISPEACTKQLNKLCQYGPELAIQAIDRAIENDYQGLFPNREPPAVVGGNDRLLTAHHQLLGVGQ